MFSAMGINHDELTSLDLAYRDPTLLTIIATRVPPCQNASGKDPNRIREIDAVLGEVMCALRLVPLKEHQRIDIL